MAIAYQQLQMMLGNWAHEGATKQYKAARPGQHLFYHNVLRIPPFTEVKISSSHITSPITRKDLSDPYLAWLLICLQSAKFGSFPLEPSDAGKSRQPDFASIELHELYEIKPNTSDQRLSGRKQVAHFRTLLQQGDREYVATGARPSGVYSRLQSKSWNLGTRFLPKPIQVEIPNLGPLSIHFSLAEPGLIVWESEGERDRAREKVRVIAKDLVRSVPQNANEAERQGSIAVNTNPGLAKAMLTAAAIIGAAALTIALAIEIVALAPIAIPIAIAFVFAYGAVTATRGTTPTLRLS